MGIRMKEFAMPVKIEWDEDSYSPTYGKFIAEPFERGYAVTVGNSLRRILLSSIEGSAVTSLKIKGVDHEFSTIKGVLEDIPQIVLNLKGLILKSHSRAPKRVTLKLSKKGDYKAGDITADETVEIINPEHRILTVTENIDVDIEMEIGRGRGWVPADRNKREDDSIGVIVIDSLFSPVTGVNFRMENTRVGAVTNYERLIIEITTDGSVEPKEALVYGAYILQRHLDVFTQMGEVVEEGEEEVVDVLDHDFLNKIKMPITELELSVRSANCLKDANINTIGDLVRLTEQQLLQHRNFGKKSLNELQDILKEMKMSFGMELPQEIKTKLQEEAV
ncbi:MAG: DNA-directed RNA polymerase subunit alpha [Candidatus Kaelpia imicola]|nr:DNA-directed RNA polymerase subunit alpha [Candidatus Kaelpia imicola]